MENSASKFTAFDEKMLALIKGGTGTAASLTSALLDEAKSLTTTVGEEFRVVDRRLQALRKKGAITWVRRGSAVVWQLTY